jgi:hypothetical protein
LGFVIVIADYSAPFSNDQRTAIDMRTSICLCRPVKC